MEHRRCSTGPAEHLWRDETGGGARAALGSGRYIISATTPFSRSDLAPLAADASAVIRERFTDAEALYAARGWRLPRTLDRVDVNDRARAELGWRPKRDFRHVLDCLAAGTDFRSPLALEVGVKGCHGAAYRDGLYPVA